MAKETTEAALLRPAEARSGVFHSERFRLSFPLPDGRAWRIDDHSQPFLMATHPSTGSRLSLIATHEDGLMNRERCEARAKDLGLVPSGMVSVVDDETLMLDGTHDARVEVATHVDPKTGAIDGHVLVFASMLRQCVLVHIEDHVSSPAEEAILATRLASARTRIVQGLKFDRPRTTLDAEVPRARPERRDRPAR